MYYFAGMQVSESAKKFDHDTRVFRLFELGLSMICAEVPSIAKFQDHQVASKIIGTDAE